MKDSYTALEVDDILRRLQERFDARAASLSRECDDMKKLEPNRKGSIMALLAEKIGISWAAGEVSSTRSVILKCASRSKTREQTSALVSSSSVLPDCTATAPRCASPAPTFSNEDDGEVGAQIAPIPQPPLLLMVIVMVVVFVMLIRELFVNQ